MRFARFLAGAFGAALFAVLSGCGDPAREFVDLGKADAGRRAEFAGAVARACTGFDGLDGAGVKFDVVTNAAECVINVRAEKMSRSRLQHALSVALTNLSLEYPGLGFMRNEDDSWRILMPGDVRIPVSGGFGIGGE